MTVRTIQGVAVPAFMYGTAWKEERTEALTRQALAAGFRAIDTANQRKHYFEAGVGDAVAASGLPREEVFLQTKFTFARGQDHRLPYDPDAELGVQVQQSFASSLEHLRTTYVDSYVLHGPTAGEGIVAADWSVWHAMEALQREGKTRLIGISNVSFEQLVALYREATVKPAFVQNRCYASTGWDRKVRSFCRSNDIVYQGFSLLTANKSALVAPALKRIAKRTGHSPAQIVFRFAQQVGMLPLTGSSSPVHLAEDLRCVDVDLTDADLAAVEAVLAPSP